mmetsp:Transcript_117817/g.375604  ORF Transcript_117817/g.375604 Transcript_117817/m.375604 type:complete len:343 (-) Transcript_117817:15-1043(-)
MVASGSNSLSRAERQARAEQEVRNALDQAGLKSKDLPALRQQRELAARHLGLSPDGVAALERLAAATEAQADGREEALLGQRLDVLNCEGEIIMDRPRVDVHREGLWHRVVHIWAICTDTNRVLLGQRSASKAMDAGRWTCACRRVPSGEQSMSTAVDCLKSEFSIKAKPDEELSLAFSARCSRPIDRGMFAGQEDNTVVDVYIARLSHEIPVEKVHVEFKSKQAVKYVSLEEFKQALKSRDEAYVIPTSDEYITKLISHLQRSCEVVSSTLKLARSRGLPDTAMPRALTDSPEAKDEGVGGSQPRAGARAGAGDATTILSTKTWHRLGVTCDAWREDPSAS